MADKTGGAAFPHNENHDDGTHWHSHAGMTLRDYFAARAFPAIYTEFWRTADSCDPDWERGLAMDAYRMADAMLAARGDA